MTLHGCLSFITNAICHSIKNEIECTVIDDVENIRTRKYMATDATIKLEIGNEKKLVSGILNE